MRLLPFILPQVLLLTACAPEVREAGPPPSAPRVVFSQTEHDFGAVEQGTTVRHMFRFVNAGGQDLSVDEIRTACDCVAARSGVGVMPPGKEGTITVEFDTEHVFAAQRRTITVYTNDPEHPVSMLSLVGKVALDVAANPPQLYVGRLHPGATFWRVVAVHRSPSVEVLSVESEGSRIVVHAERLAKGRLGVRVSVASSAAPGPLDETIVIRTTSLRRPLLRIPVVGTVEDST